MNIPAKIYANLAPAERIRAAVAALARNDDAEIQTLKDTCPKKTYLMTDPAYSEGMERLLMLAMAVEYDLLALALDYFFTSRRKSFDAADKAVSDAVSFEIAWRESLAEIGIPWPDMRDAGDTDEDGFLDGYEVLTGKLPLDPSSKPALIAEARTAIEFTFPAAVGKTYRIEDSFDLSTWGTVESGITGKGTQIQRFYTTRNMSQHYFRVEEDSL